MASETCLPHQNRTLKAGEMAKWLIVPVALAEDQSLIPGTHIKRLTTIFNASSAWLDVVISIEEIPFCS